MRCIACKEEWELISSNNKKENYCPFCGKEIIRIDKDSVLIKKLFCVSIDK